MGVSQSVVTTDDFKNYLYGTAVLMLAPRLDSALQFKDCINIVDEDKHVLPAVLKQQPKELAEVIQAYSHYYGNSGKEAAIDKYVIENVLDTEEHLAAFMQQFVGVLQDRQGVNEASIRRVMAPKQQRQHAGNTTQSVMSAHVPLQAQAPAPSPALVHAPVQVISDVSEHQDIVSKSPQPSLRNASIRTRCQIGESMPTVIKGHSKLHRKMSHINTAIDNERAAYQAQLTLEESKVHQQVEESQEPPHDHDQDPDDTNVYDENSTPEGEYVDEHTTPSMLATQQL